jgi:hypothetical protein
MQHRQNVFPSPICVRSQVNLPLGNVYQFGVLCVTTQFYHCFSLISDTAKGLFSSSWDPISTTSG